MLRNEKTFSLHSSDSHEEHSSHEDTRVTSHKDTRNELLTEINNLVAANPLTFETDLSFVDSALYKTSPDTILALFQQSQKHAAVYESSRKKSWGLKGVGGSTTAGGGAFGTLLFTQIVTLTSVPLLPLYIGAGIAAVVGMTLFAGGVKCLESDVHKMAVFESEVVKEVLKDLLEKNQYKDYVHSVLLIIHEVAKKRSANTSRDSQFDYTISWLNGETQNPAPASNDIFEIANHLVELRRTLLEANYNSETAKKIEGLINQLVDEMLKNGLVKEYVLVRISLIQDDAKVRKTVNKLRDVKLQELADSINKYDFGVDQLKQEVQKTVNDILANSSTSKAGAALLEVLKKLNDSNKTEEKDDSTSRMGMGMSSTSIQ